MRVVHLVHRTRSQHPHLRTPPPTTGVNPRRAHGQACTLPQFHHHQQQWHLFLRLHRCSRLTNRCVTTHEILFVVRKYNEDIDRRYTGTHEDSDHALAGANRRVAGRQTGGVHSAGGFSPSPYGQILTCRCRDGSCSLLGIPVN
jgi:hypothetical protein